MFCETRVKQREKTKVEKHKNHHFFSSRGGDVVEMKYDRRDPVAQMKCTITETKLVTASSFFFFEKHGFVVVLVCVKVAVVLWDMSKFDVRCGVVRVRSTCSLAGSPTQRAHEEVQNMISM